VTWINVLLIGRVLKCTESGVPMEEWRMRHGRSYFLALCKQIRDLWRKYQRTPVVALDELSHSLGSLLRLIFLEEMAGVGKHLKLEFA
jgi:hypothetical protein